MPILRRLQHRIFVALLSVIFVGANLLVLVRRSGTITLASDEPQTPKRGAWSFNSKVLIEPDVALWRNDDKKVMVCVTSAAPYVEKRQAIRESWGGHPELRVVFFLGRNSVVQHNVEQEARQYGDIVEVDFQDHYRNLTYKTVSFVLWAFRHRWPERRVVIKADDDTFVNPYLLLKHLDAMRQPGIYGIVRHRHKPIRVNGTKWSLPKKEFEPDEFPRHVQGAFYVIHEAVLERLFENVFMPKWLFIEDVYLTGLVADAAHVDRFPLPPQMAMNPYMGGLGQHKLTRTLALHYTTEKEQLSYWAQLVKLLENEEGNTLQAPSVTRT